MLAIIGMSPGNSYFKDREVAYLLRETIKRYNKAVVLVADEPAISTYLALGYNLGKATQKAILKGNNLKNRVSRLIDELGIDSRKVTIIDRNEDVKDDERYKEKYQTIQDLYNQNNDFKNIANETTKGVLKHNSKKYNDEDVKQAVHYLLSEIAFMEFCPSFFGVDKVAYVYHKNRLVFEEYIAGKFDHKSKSYLDFILLEAPYETIMSVAEAQKTRYEIIKERGTIKCGFVPYFDKFIIHKDGTYGGNFYTLIKRVADRNNLQLEFIEQVGYGVISQRLHYGYIDLFCSPTRPTSNRRLDMFFSKSLFQSNIYAYIGSESTYAHEDLQTLKTNTEIRIAVKENDIHHELALQYFPHARLVRVPQLSGIEEVLKFVLEDKADMTFWDNALVIQYMQENKIPSNMIVKKSFDATPITIFDNCFALPRGEFELKRMIDECIESS